MTHVSFFHKHNVKFLKFSCLFQKYLKRLKALNSNQVRLQYLSCNYTTFQLQISIFYMRLIFQEYPYFYQFYYRNDREQNGTYIEV